MPQAYVHEPRQGTKLFMNPSHDLVLHFMFLGVVPHDNCTVVSFEYWFSGVEGRNAWRGFPPAQVTTPG